MSLPDYIDEKDVCFKAICHEPKADVERSVWLMKYTKENIAKLWKSFSQFPILFGYNIKTEEQFLEYFLDLKGTQIVSKGIFFVVDDFVGVYYMSDIVAEADAIVHYSFFDRRHHGRVELTKQMLRYAFEQFGFQRLTTWIPMYSSQHKKDNKFINAFQFAKAVGFQYEGRKRKAAKFKGEWFDMKLFGILREECLKSKEEIE